MLFLLLTVHMNLMILGVIELQSLISLIFL